MPSLAVLTTATAFLLAAAAVAPPWAGPLCPASPPGAHASPLRSYRFYQGEAGGLAKMMADTRRERGREVGFFPTYAGEPFNVRCDYADGRHYDVALPPGARECLTSRSPAGVFNLECR